VSPRGIKPVLFIPNLKVDLLNSDINITGQTFTEFNTYVGGSNIFKTPRTTKNKGSRPHNVNLSPREKMFSGSMIDSLPRTSRTPEGSDLRHSFTDRNRSPVNDSLTIRSVMGNYSSVDYLSGALKKIRTLKEDDLQDFIASQVIGRNIMIKTPFGEKLKLYVDYTASGQEVKFICDQMMKVEELYANTHTETSYTGAYMNTLLNNAEDQIMKECNASKEDYFIIGGGSGSTYAIEMTQKILGTYLPPQTRENLRGVIGDENCLSALKDRLRERSELPLVIVSGYEHHSNEITWRKQLCDVVAAPFTLEGIVDLKGLDEILKNNLGRKIIGSFSAGSNVTGIKTNVVDVALAIKRYHGVCFFDFGAVGPYIKIDLGQKTPEGKPAIDGIYISPHKFLGGPSTCGILLINKQAYNGKLEPTHGGGGTVDYVGRNMESYTDDVFHREKSGTPGVVQIIKAGLAFELKGIMQELIDKKEVEYNSIFFERIANLNNFMLLGPRDEHAKVTIMSFNINHDGPKGMRWIHPTLVVKLLNDIFGIQGRSGCSCAGPYGHYLLGIDDETSMRFKFWIEKHDDIGDNIQIMGIKPGWARINLHYTLKEYELDYVLFALEFLCEHGAKFLPAYTFSCGNGQWNQPLKKQVVPKFSLETFLSETQTYAKDEPSRKILFKKQKKDALDLLKTLPKSKGLDSIPELGELCTYYVEKGNIIDRNLITEKHQFYNKINSKKTTCI
jgi:selenocysteine lyase/cysteine desulfurase